MDIRTPASAGNGPRATQQTAHPGLAPVKSAEWIVFDAVGTLIEPSAPIHRTYAEIARRFGVRVDPADVRRRFQSALRAAFDFIPRTTDAKGSDETASAVPNPTADASTDRDSSAASPAGRPRTAIPRPVVP
ncbi:MAG: hypothetical protein D6725_12815, partial [Planctomycetota bacterium]